MKFFDIFETLCKQNNTSVTAVLKEIGLSSSKGTAWRKGSIPSGDILVQIAEYFNVSVDYLLGYTVETNNEEQELIDFFVNLSIEHKRLAIKLVKAVLEASK